MTPEQAHPLDLLRPIERDRGERVQPIDIPLDEWPARRSPEEVKMLVVLWPIDGESRRE